MRPMRPTLAILLFVLPGWVPQTAADDFSAVEYERRTMYHSPQKPGFTSWVGAWIMPDESLMVSFTEATGPALGRPSASKDVRHKLTWPPEGHPGYDMTGLDLRNVHLRSTDAGKRWQRVSADAFKSCMNGITGEAQTALADGTILRGVWGYYLPYNPELPKTGYLERSADGSRTWGKPEILLDPAKYSAWPKRIRVLRDGQLIVIGGVAHIPANSRTRAEYNGLFEPLLMVSSDNGRTWEGPIPIVPPKYRDKWGGEEFDTAELPNGDLLCVFRRVDPANNGREVRWQGLLKKSGDSWIPGEVGPAPFPHSGHPELLNTREGPILHVATNGIHWTSDAGKNWHKLGVPGTAYYPRSIQMADGRILMFGHVGGDDEYGKVDQSIIMDSFRLVGRDIEIKPPRTLPPEKLQCDRVPLGEADDYKPCIAQLPSGELLLTAFHQHKRVDNKVMEQSLLFRSKDGGRSWSKPEKLDLFGREPYLTMLKDGTIFITGHLLANDVRNQWGYTCGFLHRSTDSSKTWESIRIESEGIKPKASNHSTRNVLQLTDSTLLLGVDYDGGDGPYLIWRSKDNGKTWDKSGKCQPKDFKSQYGFFGGETWLWQAKSGKIWALVRVDSNEFPMKDRPIQAKNDQADHFILFSSKDEGKTFDRIHDFGDYGEMYMSILRLKDKRLLLTFTVRDLKPPLGVRAIVGKETDDGFNFDFTRDRIMLDTRTPVDKYQGGGFGPTVQLKDGTLVTSYSYRGADDKTHLEVVRWKLLAARSPEKPRQGNTTIPNIDKRDVPPPSGAPEGKQRTVSRESIEYLQKLRKNTPFGAKDFDLAALRAGMGSRREPKIKDIKLIRVKINDTPCEWVVAPGADPDLRLLYLHGGGFVSGSGGFYLTLAAHISKAAKCAVLLPDYQLAPEHPFPAGLDDCVRAHDWMIANGPSGPAPARATFVAGDSAGGNLTLATVLALRDRKRPQPAGGIALSPMTDLTLASESLKTANDPIISAKTMPVFRDHYLDKTAPRNPLASPVFGDYRGIPPLLIQVGEHEMLRDDSVRVTKKARSDGITVKLEVWPGMFHVFQSHEPLLPEGKEAIEHIAEFMRTSLPRR